VVDLLLNIQFNLLTGTENTNNVRRNIRQDYDLPAIVNGNRQYLFSSTRPEALRGSGEKTSRSFRQLPDLLFQRIKLHLLVQKRNTEIGRAACRERLQN